MSQIPEILPEILFEGSYLYYENNVNYSQENFKLVRMIGLQQTHIYSEITSRVENGEFLKIIVRYEMNQHYIPFFVRIEKSIGSRYAHEVFKYDEKTQELHYTFQTPEHTQEFTRSLNTKHYLTSPSFATSAIFTLSKKFDATGRTGIVLLGSSNEWEYKNPPEEKVIFAEYKSRDPVDITVNNTSLSAHHLQLFEFDATNSKQVDEPVDVFLSKHYALPYQLQHKNQKIVIKNLKKHTSSEGTPKI